MGARAVHTSVGRPQTPPEPEPPVWRQVAEVSTCFMVTFDTILLPVPVDRNPDRVFRSSPPNRDGIMITKTFTNCQELNHDQSNLGFLLHTKSESPRPFDPKDFTRRTDQIVTDPGQLIWGIDHDLYEVEGHPYMLVQW